MFKLLTGIWLGGLRKIMKYLKLIRNRHLPDTKLLEWNEMERARKEG